MGLIIRHRVNTIDELKNVDSRYGVELDIRHDTRSGRLYLNHDPGNGEDFENYLNFLSKQGNRFAIFNVKEVGIEQTIIDLAKKYKIENYFLLDVEFPFIFRAAYWDKYSMSPVQGLDGRLAIRYSEAEPIEQALIFKGIFKWLLVDTNTLLPLDGLVYSRLRSNDGYKLCMVSPERWGRPQDIQRYIDILRFYNINLDAVMTSENYVKLWDGGGVLNDQI